MADRGRRSQRTVSVSTVLISALCSRFLRSFQCRSAAMAASSSGLPAPPGLAARSHLHSSSSLPLLGGFSSGLPLPHTLLDFGLRSGPIWPVGGQHKGGAGGTGEKGWKMTNQRGQSPQAGTEMEL
jgi:hypothetical protein